MDLESAERDAIAGTVTACHRNLTLAAQQGSTSWFPRPEPSPG